MITPEPEIARRLLADHFGAVDGQFIMGGVRLTELALRFGTPLYVYDAALIRQRLSHLRANLPQFDIYYSVKANPNPSLLQLLLQQGCGLEVASVGELQLACAAGCQPSRIMFAGPGKTDDELNEAVSRGIGEIHVESFQEIERLATFGGHLERSIPVAIRINPKLAVQSGAQAMGGRATPFGIDEELLPEALQRIQAHPALSLSGIHVFYGTQNLNALALISIYGHIAQIAKLVANSRGHPLATIDFGGGFGVPYFEGDSPLDLTALGNGVVPIVQAIRSHPLLAATNLIVEPGRFLTAEAGVFVSRVTDIKQSRGTRYAVLDGGMAQHLPASGNFGQVLKRNFPLLAANRLEEPLSTTYELVGPLCTPLDVVGRAVRMPVLKPGDLIAILQSGAYARTTSPLGFLSHPEPCEVLVDGGQARVIRKRRTFPETARGTCLDQSADS